MKFTKTIVLVCGLACASSVLGQDLSRLAKDPNSPQVQAEKEAAKARIAREKIMRQIRYKYFRAHNNTGVRQEGILQLRQFNDPVAYKSLIDIFEDQGEDVQRAFLDMFADAQTEEGDAALAWCGVFGKQEDFRQRAIDRLKGRIKERNGEVGEKVKKVVFGSLRTENEDAIAHGATMSAQLGLLEAIPYLIPAQVGRTGAAVGEADRVGDRAWIAVGTQTAFVSDLTPVVSQSSAAFDPQLDVVTDGALLRIQDAVVTTVFRPIVSGALRGLGSAVTGQDLRPLGYDIPRWWGWYKEQYLPALAAKQEQEKAAAEGTSKQPSSGG